MDTAVIKLIVVLLFGIVVGGGVYMVLFVMEALEQRAAQAAALAAEIEAGTGEGDDAAG